MTEGHAPLDGHQIEDDLLGDQLAPLGLGAVEGCDHEQRSTARRVPQLVDKPREGLLVLGAIELPEVALVGAVLEDDEARVAQRQLLLPVGGVLPLPVDRHGRVRPERVVDDAGPVALEGDAEEARRPSSRGPHGDLRLSVDDLDRVHPRHLRVAPRREALGRAAATPPPRRLRRRAARGSRRRSARRCGRSRPCVAVPNQATPPP